MQNDPNKKEKLVKKISANIGQKLEEKALLFRVFDEPRPKYVAKIIPTDRVFQFLILWAIPRSVRPNLVTVFRFVSIPFLVILLLNNDYTTAFILFIISGMSDVVDGALARTRDEITDWGIVFDPLADKLLVGTVGGILMFKFLNPILAFFVIGMESLLVLSAYYRFKGKYVPARTAGKIKMFLECVGVGFIFLFPLTHDPIFLTIATDVLYGAIFFAFLSVSVYRSI